VEEIDVPGALDLSGGRVAFVVLAHIREVVGIIAEHTADSEWPLPRWGQLVHALLVLDEPEDKVAFLKGATADVVTVLAPEALLVYGCPGESEFSVLVEEVDSVLTGELIFFLRVIHDAWRVVVDVYRYDGFRSVD
jgi:hypothetical protein